MFRPHNARTLLATLLLSTLGASSVWAQASEMSSGEIRKVDKAASKITIKHGEIKNLDMPPMTMVFQVRDPALLEKTKAGDKVRFSAELKDGAYIVTAVEAAP
jgi:Cu/Ag efflux protein CusF